MKYIKIILVFAMLMALLYLFSFLNIFFGHDFYQYADKVSLLKKYGFFIGYGVEVVLFTSLVFINIGLIKVTKQGYFNILSSKFIYLGGVFFMMAGSIDILYCITSAIIDNNPEVWLQRIFTDGLLIMLGLVCLIVSDVIKKGSLLKTENDLTI